MQKFALQNRFFPQQIDLDDMFGQRIFHKKLKNCALLGQNNDGIVPKTEKYCQPTQTE